MSLEPGHSAGARAREPMHVAHGRLDPGVSREVADRQNLDTCSGHPGSSVSDTVVIGSGDHGASTVDRVIACSVYGRHSDSMFFRA